MPCGCRKARTVSDRRAVTAAATPTYRVTVDGQDSGRKFSSFAAAVEWADANDGTVLASGDT